MTPADPRPRKALGRGLAALIPPAGGATSTDAGGLKRIAIERIRPCATQPRKVFDPDKLEELTESIRDRGVLQPVLVRRVQDHYELVAGERRWRAASRAGLQEIPALVKELV